MQLKDKIRGRLIEARLEGGRKIPLRMHRALISIGGIQRDKHTSPDFIKIHT